MFTPVDPAIKEKVISAYLTGKGRNQITRELHEQGVRVSHGSISNIIGAYKCKHEQPLQYDTSRIEQANITTNIVTPKDGGPLSNFLIENTTTNIDVNNLEQKDSVRTQEKDIDFVDTPFLISNPNADYDGVNSNCDNSNSEPEIEVQRTKIHPKSIDSNPMAKYIARIPETSVQVQVEKSIDEKLEQVLRGDFMDPLGCGY